MKRNDKHIALCAYIRGIQYSLKITENNDKLIMEKITPQANFQFNWGG